MKKPLIVLTGPTAVGKTRLSISLAKAIGGEIISADSMQVYKYMDIGSAKITLCVSNRWQRMPWKRFTPGDIFPFWWGEPAFIFRR